MPVSEATYERVAVEDGDGTWELFCGELVRKPEMTTEHDFAAHVLAHRIQMQVSLQDYLVQANSARLRYSGGRYFVPDVVIVPMAFMRELHRVPGTFQVYDQSIPLVVEVWSPSTGRYDINDKLPIYRERGDAEVWRIHPYDRIVTRWVHQSDGGYTEDTVRGGSITLAALPQVTIELDTLFTI